MEPTTPNEKEQTSAAVRTDDPSATKPASAVNAAEQPVNEKIAPLKIDILVNNARLDPYLQSKDASDGEWFNALLNVNLTGAYLCCQAVKAGMKERRWGRIVNMSSVQA